MLSFRSGNPKTRALTLLLALGCVGGAWAQSATPFGHPPEFFQTYCVECHSAKKAKGKVNLEKMLGLGTIGSQADTWDKVAEMIETAEMPPDDAKLIPSDSERGDAAKWVRTTLQTYEIAHANEPGHVTVRRLTSGEYSYVVRDLTGVDIPVGIDASSDSVGGEGFTNFGDVQFVQDTTIERFLEAAKAVADHAVVGSGPLIFSPDAGRTGVELSALNRINEIYAAKGFRVASGEGGRPFGLDRYGKAFFVSWYFRNRVALGDPQATLAGLAAKEGITSRFAQHIWDAINRPSPGYPTSLMLGRWQAIPAPGGDPAAAIARARADCDALYQFLTTWPSWFFARGDLAAGGQGDESPLEFDDVTLKAETKHTYSYRLGAPVFPPAPAGVKPVLFVETLAGPWSMYLSFDNVNPLPGVTPAVVWRNPRVIVREVVRPGDEFLVGARVVLAARQKAISGPVVATRPLRSLLPADKAAAFKFGASVDGAEVGADDFVATGPLSFTLSPADFAADIGGRDLKDLVFIFEADAEVGRDHNAVARVMIADEQPAKDRDKRHRILIGDPASAGYKTFREGMAEFVALLPPNSHGEANPADRDAVPLPFDNTYNGAEHDAFVTKVKYQRKDAFFTANLVDGEDREHLNQAWNDLFGSWPYHTAYLDLLADHYGVKLKSPRIEDLDDAAIAAMPAEAQPYVAALRQHYREVETSFAAAEPGHVEDALAFAERAWRRPLAAAEKDRLRAFYRRCRSDQALDHDDAIKALLARILVSPGFLYRAEPDTEAGERTLTDWELASRMSFFLWSSIPDDELRRAAAAGELRDTAKLAAQVRRMTADPKARRLATEFFGQWFGFYRFDEFRGVDTTRFPEFTQDVQRAMYDEAVSTFDYIVRENRPVREILHADYTFLNQPLAKFYGLDVPVKSAAAVEKVDGASRFDRGGVLRLGSVLTTTSAPLRTSPVKRGDWVLRRVLGTPTPPPPPDAGTLPSDPKAFGGHTLRERLELHKRNPTCANCHVRIDPLGFPLESFDAIGRSRTAYQDGTAVDANGVLADKTTLVGADGLLKYLDDKEPLVMKTLARKLVGYALGRTVSPSDKQLIADLTHDGDRTTFADLAVKIVSSRQFRNRQGDEAVHNAASPAESKDERRATSANPNHPSAGMN